MLGGTSKPTGLGSRTLAHLRAAEYPGTVVVPARGEPLDRDVDVAVIAVPAAAVHDVLDSVDGRTKFAVIFSSGFEEVGGEALRTSRGTVLIGPNTVGLYHAQSRATLTFAQAFDSLVDCRHGSGAFLVSQSGAFGARVVSAAARFGLHLDGFIGSGNEAHLDACTLARGALAVAQPKVLMLYLEGLRDAVTLEALLADARNAGVPVVCLLGGLSDAGANAAASHTAAVSADAAVVDELFRAYGATLVRSDRDLILSALAYSVLGTARGRRVGIVTGSGGAGVVASDLLSTAGVTLPALSAPTRSALAALLPAIATTGNPVDVTAQTVGDDVLLGKVCDELRNSGEVDAILVVGREDQARSIGAVAGAAVPTVLACLDREPANVRPLIEAGEMVLPDLDSACKAVAAVTRFAGPRNSAVPRREPTPGPWQRLDGTPSAAESLSLVEDAGVETADWQLARSVGQVAEIGETLGWPVVLKADSAAEVHKARAGGVKLDVDRARAGTAAEELFASGAGGVIVAKQLRSSMELFVGVRRDPQWGLVVSAGLGGANIELLNRTVALPAFLGEEHLAARLEEEIFLRVPGRYSDTGPALARAATRLVRLAAATGAALVECNPLGWVDSRLVALDARVVL
ncbi:acetate--CoA ligase family protein (plasmid) [Rhodococcus ruber]|uniref:acetate--CoA ligase family protein n=1 Tax=Rhodococcus ruber TaxID=1830 RepID=UPI00200E2C4E|nr:acetate--CoA ligase family protein [Rhodococcus ruber]UQB75792.1 acetate--CoA ligase family protein [Rhodococcus ruber]